MEMGQWIFGNPWGNEGCPDYVDALLRDLLREIERVWWNNNQDTLDLSHGGNDWITEIFQLRTYRWEGTDEEKALPNLAFENVEVRWYKYPGRSVTLNVKQTPAEWVAWYDKFLAAIRAEEDDKHDFNG